MTDLRQLYRQEATASHPVDGARAAASPRAHVWALAGFLLLGAAALLPRALDLGRFITDDEANFWLHRSEVFLSALRSGDYVQTALTNHPGVTTMWLGAAGIVLRQALLDWGLLHSDAFPVVLALMRLPAVLVHVMAILLGYRLLRRMLPAATALLAALLWAADPFVIAYSRLLHTDALAMSFATLSMLAACWFWNHQAGRHWLIVSGVSAGLALLSKSPALVLVPAVGLLALRAQTRDRGPSTKNRGSSTENQGPGTKESKARSALVSGGWSFVRPLAAWVAIAALTIFALWPALWVDPIEAYRKIQIGVTVEGAQPHMLGNFFLGRQDDAPGPLYYAVALPLRLTPWTLMGLLLLPLAWRPGRRFPATLVGHEPPSSPCVNGGSAEPGTGGSTLRRFVPVVLSQINDPPVGARARRDLAALAGFALLFVAAMSVFPKKFDRYIVPVFPALDILAAVGIVGAGLWVLDKARSPSSDRQSAITTALVSGIALAAIVNVVWWQPYQIVAFNQLFGGTAAGARTFFVGWGEGLEQVAAWLNEQPDSTSVRTVALRITSLNPYLKEGAQADFPRGDQLRDRTGYVVVYLPQTQGAAPSAPFDRFFGHAAPLHVVHIHGVDFAWIYQAPPVVAQARGAGFGPDIRLYGFDGGGAWRRGQTTRLALAWQTSARPPADYWMFAHLIGPDGRRYAQLDLPLPTSQWAIGRFATTELPITPPQGAPAGAYRLLIGLYAREGRLALAPDDPRDAAADSMDALVLARFELQS